MRGCRLSGRAGSSAQRVRSAGSGRVNNDLIQHLSSVLRDETTVRVPVRPAGFTYDEVWPRDISVHLAAAVHSVRCEVPATEVWASLTFTFRGQPVTL